MSYLATLRERRKTPVAAWHKLRTSLGTRKFDFYVVFEGEEDEEFYSNFIEKRFAGKKFRPVICDGKGGVFALHEEMIKSYGGPRNVFFFVDLDHDPFLGQDKYPSQTFVTCGYSVENYIYDDDVILAGINKYFRINPSDDLVYEIRQDFTADRKVFEYRTKIIMSYAIALRAKDQNPKLDDIGLSSIFNIQDSGLRARKNNCRRLLELAKVEALDAAEVMHYARMVRTMDPKKYVRGKLIAQFVVNFCRRLAARYSEKTKINGKPLRSSFQFSKSSFVSAFGSFAKLPKNLSDFFEEIDAALASK